jgi:alkaline phosphatase
MTQTYNSDFMVSDSASTAFAMYSGVKTTGYTMGYDNTIENMNLGSVENATEVTTILDWAQDAGKMTGFVTNTRMGHATPGALYAKTVSRFWECENDWKKDIEDGKVTQEDINKFKVGNK